MPAPDKTLYIAIYTHRHGVDVWPIWSKELPKIEENLPEDWEPDRDDEFFEIAGPFPGPTAKGGE